MKGLKNIKVNVKSIIIGWAMVLGIVLFDQLTKLYFVKNYELGESRVFIEGVLNWTFHYNDGMAFSWLSGNMRLLAYVSLIAGILISFGFIYFDLTNKRMMLYNIALVFILGGCFGNMIDRFFRPDLGVVDFIEPVFVDFAIFNVADSFLTVGAILLAIHTIFISDKPKEKKEEAKEEVKEETVND